MDQTEFLPLLAKALNSQRYLEIGVQQGATFYPMQKIVPYCIGVDIVPVSIPGVLHMSSAEFFARNTELFDLILIDADHAFDMVVHDVVGALQCLQVGGLLTLHDTDPSQEKFEAPGICNDAYRIVSWLQTNQLCSVTIPLDAAGLTLVMKPGETRTERRKNK